MALYGTVASAVSDYYSVPYDIIAGAVATYYAFIIAGVVLGGLLCWLVDYYSEPQLGPVEQAVLVKPSDEPLRIDGTSIVLCPVTATYKKQVRGKRVVDHDNKSSWHFDLEDVSPGEQERIESIIADSRNLSPISTSELPDFAVFIGVEDAHTGAITAVGAGWREGKYLFTARHVTDTPGYTAFGRSLVIFRGPMSPKVNIGHVDTTKRYILGPSLWTAKCHHTGFDIQALYVPDVCWTRAGVKSASAYNYSAKHSEAITVYGIPYRSGTPQVGYGHMAKTEGIEEDTGLFGHTANTLPGFSGSPVVANLYGRKVIMGCHVSGAKTPTDKHNYAVSAWSIYALRRKAGLATSVGDFSLNRFPYVPTIESVKRRRLESAQGGSSQGKWDALDWPDDEQANWGAQQAEKEAMNEYMRDLARDMTMGDEDEGAAAERTDRDRRLKRKFAKGNKIETPKAVPESKVAPTPRRSIYSMFCGTRAVVEPSMETDAPFESEREKMTGFCQRLKTAVVNSGGSYNDHVVMALLSAFWGREFTSTEISTVVRISSTEADSVCRALSDIGTITRSRSGRGYTIGAHQLGGIYRSWRSPTSRPSYGDFHAFSVCMFGKDTVPSYTPAVSAPAKPAVKATSQGERRAVPPTAVSESVVSPTPAEVAAALDVKEPLPALTTMFPATPAPGLEVKPAPKRRAKFSPSVESIPENAKAGKRKKVVLTGLRLDSIPVASAAAKSDPDRFMPLLAKKRYWSNYVGETPPDSLPARKGCSPDEVAYNMARWMREDTPKSAAAGLDALTNVGVDAVMALPGMAEFKMYLAAGGIERLSGTHPTMNDRDGKVAAKCYGTSRNIHVAPPKTIKHMSPEFVAAAMKCGFDFSNGGGTKFAMPPTGTDALRESLQGQLGKQTADRGWTHFWDLPDFDERYTRGLDDMPRSRAALFDFKERFNTVVDGFDGSKSAGWSANYLAGTKAVWKEAGRDRLYYLAKCRIALRFACEAELPTMSPERMVELGLKDPAIGTIKYEAHSASKQASKRWRIIWVASMLDSTVQGICHTRQNKANIASYQSGRQDRVLVGLGHHDEGIERLGDVLTRIGLFNGLIWDEDAEGWDLSVCRDGLVSNGSVRCMLLDDAQASPEINETTCHMLMHEAFCNTSHVLCIGKSLWELQIQGMTSSGAMSTGDQNSDVRQRQAILAGAAIAAALGDDLVGAGDMCPVRIAKCGTLTKEMTTSDKDGPINITSHRFVRGPDGRWSATFNKFGKLMAHVDLRRPPGLPPKDDVIRGVMTVLRHTPGAEKMARAIFKELGWNYTLVGGGDPELFDDLF
jgi:hypothetical protein